jgi:hypothetical protein
MSYQSRDFGEVTTPRCFDAPDEVYAYAASAADLTEQNGLRSTLSPWTLWRLDGGREAQILAEGELLARAEGWRRP